MISENMTTCVPKIVGCEISVVDQPVGLNVISIDPDKDLATLNSYTAYSCPKCKDGYYKDDFGVC